MAAGGVLIDIRPAAQRAEQGEIPGSTIVERNHLEWRLDPCSDARLPWVTATTTGSSSSASEGYTSSLAAAALQDLGLHRATDMIGGFRAWTAEGLPAAPAAESAPGAHAGPGAGPGAGAGLTPFGSLPLASSWDRPFQARLIRWAATSSSLGLRASSHHWPVNATMPTSIWAYIGASLGS